MKRALALLACAALLCSGAAAFPSLDDAASEVSGTVTAAVDDALPVATAAGGRGWDSVLDLIDNKNGTERLSEAVQSAADAGTIDISDLQESNWTGTVFAPLDSAFDAPGVEEALADPSLAAQVLAYHIIPGEALTLAQLRAMDGQLLQSMLDGASGELKVEKRGRKAALLTSSGQEVALYQTDIRAGSAIVHTIKGVLVPGNETLKADAAAPTPAPAPAKAPMPAKPPAPAKSPASPPPSPAPSPSPPPPPKGPCKYTVQSGDFLYSIADKFKVSADQILALNPQYKDRPESIPLGAELIVPC